MKLLESVRYAIWRGGDARERATGALEALRAGVAEFEYLAAALPGGVEAHAGQAPEKPQSRLEVESPAGVKIEAQSAAPEAFGDLHRSVLEEAAGLLRRALRFEAAPGSTTAALHGGQAPFVLREPAVTPIYQTTAYEFDSVAQLEEFLSDQERGYIYSRWGNPTVTEAQERLAALTGAQSALLFSSGMGAISSVLLTLLGSGERLVALRHLYGGTVSLLGKVLPRMGIEVALVELEDIGALADKLEGAKVFYFESMPNPTLRVPDVKAIVRACAEAGVVSVCDNTFATPCNVRTLDYGVDVEVYSGSKYLSGHTDVVIGATCASREIISKVNLTMRYLGTNAGPFEAFLLSRGLRTLALRVERHNANALALARRLRELESVRSVWYPGLEGHPDHANAGILNGAGGMVTFEVDGGLDRVRAVTERFRMVRALTTLGSLETTFCIPVLSSHYGLEPETLAKVGVTGAMIRASVGLEDVRDIIADFEQALGTGI